MISLLWDAGAVPAVPTGGVTGIAADSGALAVARPVPGGGPPVAPPGGHRNVAAAALTPPSAAAAAGCVRW